MAVGINGVSKKGNVGLWAETESKPAPKLSRSKKAEPATDPNPLVDAARLKSTAGGKLIKERWRQLGFETRGLAWAGARLARGQPGGAGTCRERA
eukprot:8301688-Alexandrium_andersonii.AAC.1